MIQVEGDTEWVEVRVHWFGGHETYSRVRRPIAESTRLSRWPEMIARLKELKNQGLSSHEIASHLNKEGFKPAKGDTITANVVRIWLSRHGLTQTRRNNEVKLGDNEWTIPSIVERYELSNSRVHGWIRRGLLNATQVSGPGSRWIIQASQQHIEQLVVNRADKLAARTTDPTNSKPVSRGAS